MKVARTWPVAVALAVSLALVQTGAVAKGPGPGPGPSPSPTPPPVTGCGNDADAYPPSPVPVPYANSSARVVVVGYMGASMAAEGYQALGGRGMSTAAASGPVAILPNAGLTNFVAGSYWTCSPRDGGVQRFDLWPAYVDPQFGGEQAVWWLAALTDDEWRNLGRGNASTVRAKMEIILAEIRERTSAPVYVSAPPDMSSAPSCKTLQPAYSAAVQATIDAMVADGEVLRGPILPPLSSAQKMNRCHPNAAGKAAWGQALLSVFGA